MLAICAAWAPGCVRPACCGLGREGGEGEARPQKPAVGPSGTQREAAATGSPCSQEQAGDGPRGPPVFTGSPLAGAGVPAWSPVGEKETSRLTMAV